MGSERFRLHYLPAKNMKGTKKPTNVRNDEKHNRTNDIDLKSVKSIIVNNVRRADSGQHLEHASFGLSTSGTLREYHIICSSFTIQRNLPVMSNILKKFTLVTEA